MIFKLNFISPHFQHAKEATEANGSKTNGNSEKIAEEKK